MKFNYLTLITLSITSIAGLSLPSTHNGLIKRELNTLRHLPGIFNRAIAHYTRSSHTGPVATECKFDTKFESIKEEKDLDELLDSCKKALKEVKAKRLDIDVVTIHRDFVGLTEIINEYRNIRFPGNSKRSEEGLISKVCKLSEKIEKVKERKEFDNILADCGKSYTELLVKDQSKSEALNKEFIGIQNAIQVAQEKFAVTQQNKGKDKSNTNNDTENSNKVGTEIATYAKVDEKLSKIKKSSDFDELINAVNEAFATLNIDSSKTVKLQDEVDYLKDKIIKAKNSFKGKRSLFSRSKKVLSFEKRQLSKFL